MTEALIWGFGLSAQAEAPLQRLLNAGLIDRVALPPDGQAWQSQELQAFLSDTWPQAQALVAVGAAAPSRGWWPPCCRANTAIRRWW